MAGHYGDADAEPGGKPEQVLAFSAVACPLFQFQVQVQERGAARVEEDVPVRGKILLAEPAIIAYPFIWLGLRGPCPRL